MIDEFTAYVLRTRLDHDLDGYTFQSAAHAREWMSQPFVPGSGYRVEVWLARRVNCPCGGSRYVKRIRKVATVQWKGRA